MGELRYVMSATMSHAIIEIKIGNEDRDFLTICSWSLDQHNGIRNYLLTHQKPFYKSILQIRHLGSGFQINGKQQDRALLSLCRSAA
jgi:hypothetical protein